MEAKAKRNGAYVTFLAGDGDYVKGVVGLVKGLRKVKSAYPLWPCCQMCQRTTEGCLRRKDASSERSSPSILPKARHSSPWPIMSSTTPARAPYRMTLPELAELRKQLDELFEAGLIRRAKAPYGAPVLF